MTPLSSAPTSALSSTLASRGNAPIFRRLLFNAFSGMTQGRLRIDLPDGSSAAFGANPARMEMKADDASLGAVIRVRREVFFKRCFWSGDIGFGESYIDGDWETPDLCAVVAFFVQNVANAPTLSGSRRRASTALNLLRLANRVGHLLRANTRATARRNISEHYDLSNEFFALWLDPAMMYSAARWPLHAPHLSLAEAQTEKNDALCRKLQLRASDHVLEIGTGWGGWAIHAARSYGCRVTTVTLSRAQFDLARQRVAAAGLASRVEVQLRDFRDVTGCFDKIVSIEMLEAIGHRNHATFADAVARLLKPHGLLALQFITCPDSRYEYFRRGVDFIQKHIFPGSLLLSQNRLNDLLARSGDFVLNSMEDFGPDYARTLKLWREAFEAKIEQVRALGFDERFTRKWSYYLSYCEAAFALRNISVVHTLHTRPNNVVLK